MSVSARPARNTHFTPSALCPLTPLPPLPGAAAVAACYSCIFYDATQVAQIMHKPMKHATGTFANASQPENSPLFTTDFPLCAIFISLLLFLPFCLPSH